ncbi:MAG: hypothetical protein LBG81_06090 [Coriobacteriaceae bacterium]|jgi:hypothetical protein|nr:hypothetical protein [Coriobacteriaceae bacterium]
MARSFRSSRFRRREGIGEEVNPSAYIVNLADCMLVLACGFMVSMIIHWNIDVAKVTELESDQLEEVNPEKLPEGIDKGGSYYIEAGKVYRDPATGQLYLVEEDPAETAGNEGAPSGQGAASLSDGTEADGAQDDGASGAGQDGAALGGRADGSAASGQGSSNPRANGAD